MVNSLRAQTPANHVTDNAAGYAMGQGNALKSYYGALLENPNVRAGLATIQATEGTAKNANPYSTDFGGGTLSSLDAHPGKVHGFTETTGKKNKTTAAGAYQFLSGTWKSIASKLGLTDFGPLSQDIAALGLIDQAGALADLVSGNVKGFVSKVNGTWASLPGAPYAQPTKSWGFVENAWNNALDPTKDSLPGTAPTPYGPNDPQSFADARPDNQNYGGPKGLFSIDTSHAAPIGHVSRSPLGPAAPSVGQTASSSRPSISGTAPSPDRPDNHNYGGPIGMGGPGGTYVDKASADAATAATHAAASAARQAASAPSAPASAAPSSAPSPSRPDSLGGVNYSSPKGVFSVDPGAVVSGISVAPAPSAPSLGPTAPAVGMPSVAPTRPAIAPVPAAAVPKPAVQVAPVAPPTPSYSPSKAVAPARPAISAADVYGGTVGTAQTTTPGTTVSRATSYGPSYVTNQYGVTTATAPDGTQMAAWGGVPPAKPAISGPLSNTGITAPPSTGIGGMFGPKAKAATGTIAGAAIGGYALGPLGAMLGGLIGKNVAAGKAPLSGIFGGSNNANTHIVDTYDGPMRAANAVGGLGFPGKPSGPAPGGVAAGMRGLSPGAANAIDHGQGGLY